MTSRGKAICSLVVAALAGCDDGDRPRATARDCVELADRIVALETQEQGFRDPVLLERQQRALRTTLSAQRRQCEGRPLRPGALDCAREATTTEQLSHTCLR